MFDKIHITKRVVHVLVYSLLCVPVCSQANKYNSLEENVLKLLCKNASSTILLRETARDFFANPTIDESLSVFTMEMDKGFVFACEQDGKNMIIAYSKDSQLDINNLPPAFIAWIEQYNSKSTYTQTIAPERSNVQPLLVDTKWGQGDPYNRQCPIHNGSTSVTGCVATAMAQVMRYYQYPDVGRGTIDYYTNSNHIHVVRDLSAYPFRWEKMRGSYGNKTSGDEGDAVASLMASCGASVHMDYSSSASGAYQQDLVRGYVSNFEYDEDCAYVEREYFTNAEWHSMLQDELAHGRPVNYGGSSKTDGGHSFVIDGFVYENGSTPYYHINWGWNGNCDGYYLISDLHPVNNGIPEVNQGFSSNQSMVIGVQPPNGEIDRENILCVSQMTLSEQSACPGRVLTLHAIGMTNCSYKSYGGELFVDIGDTLLIGEKKLHEIEFMERGLDAEIQLAIPDDAKLGKYDVFIRTTTGDKIHSPSTLYLNVTSHDGYDDSFVSDAELSVSELEVAKTEEGAAAINAYEVFNNSIDEFSGTVYIGISNWDGELQVLADSVKIDFIDSYSTLGDPVTFHIDASSIKLQDGIYDLKVYAKSGNKLVPLLLWEQYGSTRVMKPLSLTIIVKGHSVSIDGVDLNTDTSITNIAVNDNARLQTLYNLSGIPNIGGVSYGIVIKNGKKYIVRQ